MALALSPPEPVSRLWPNDFIEFGEAYKAHRLRVKGRAPSPITIRRKRTNLSVAAVEAGVTTLPELALVLADRRRTEVLLDKLSLRMTPGSVQAVVYALVDYAYFARQKGWITEHCLTPADIPPSNPDPAITVYSELEMEKLVSAALGRGLRWFCFMAYLCDTGRRVGETLNLRWDWFRLEQRPPYVEVPTTKTDPQYVPLTKRLYHDVFTPTTIETLKGVEREGTLPWTRSPIEHPFPWHYATANERFQRFCKMVNVPYRGFHNIRHSVITERLASGIPLHAVSKLAGHSSVQITDRRYNHTTSLQYAHYLEHDWAKKGGKK